MSHRLDSLFFPKSVAVVGASPNPQGWGGTAFLARLKNLDFPGDLIPVHPKAKEIMGLKTYPTVVDIPKPPEFVMIAVSSAHVVKVLNDCVQAGVKNVHIFTSGFAETGEEEGRKLQDEVVKIIEAGGLNVVGPNCMGLYVPKSKLAGWGVKPEGTGSFAFLSQSGGHGEILSAYAQGLGIHFSKMISFGNALGLKVSDYLEYLEQDDDTEIIAIYLEGIENDNELARQIRRINRKKPIILWKGGLTETGSRAIKSHTGSLAGKGRIWDAFFAQTGAIRVYSLEEMIDIALLFKHMKRPSGRETLLLGGGGGNSVAFADICGRAGLGIPPITDESRDKLNSFIKLAGNSTRNPLDVWMVQGSPELYTKVLETAIADPAIDLAIIDRVVGLFEMDESLDDTEIDTSEFSGGEDKINDYLIKLANDPSTAKPIIITTNVYGNVSRSAGLAEIVRRKFINAGVPAFTSLETASKAIVSFIKYHEYMDRNH